MQQQEYFSLADVAKLVHAQPFRIHYWLTTGQIPEPTLRIGNRRIWTLPEIVAVKARAEMERTKEMNTEGGSHV